MCVRWLLSVCELRTSGCVCAFVKRNRYLSSWIDKAHALRREAWEVKVEEEEREWERERKENLRKIHYMVTNRFVWINGTKSLHEIEKSQKQLFESIGALHNNRTQCRDQCGIFYVKCLFSLFIMRTHTFHVRFIYRRTWINFGRREGIDSSIQPIWEFLIKITDLIQSKRDWIYFLGH